MPASTCSSPRVRTSSPSTFEAALGHQKGQDDTVAFCLALPERAGVVAVPSSVFYQDQRDGQHLARFCFAKNDALLVEAGRRLVAAFG